MNYVEAIEYLYNLKIYGMSLGLERIEHLLSELGSSHKDLNAIHVTGTNGKGSVCAMLHSILHSAGYKVGLFTSPHLVSFEERIVVGRERIPKNEICGFVEEIKPIAESMVESKKFDHPTFFEIVTAMAFEHFRKENVDFAVLEVGLGGRLDATNVVTPLVSVITTVALDHTHVLGKSLEEVAREKAGIIKPKVPVVTGIDDETILSLIKNVGKERKCQVHATKERGKYILKNANLEGQIFDLEDKGERYKDLKIRLVGEHQLKNAQIALITLKVLEERGIAISEESIREGFERTTWPGRLEIISHNPTIVLDGAHNPAGMNALNSTLQELFEGKKLTLVIGMMRDKDIPGIVREIAYLADNIIITRPDMDRAADPKIIATEVRKYSDKVMIIEKVANATEYAINNTAYDDVICISGSIYNVGEAMVKLDKMNIRPLV